MKKLLSAFGVLFCLVILFSACSDDKSSAPPAVAENPEEITPDTTSSSSKGDVPTSSENPQSSAGDVPASSEVPQSSAGATSSESQESSSSIPSPLSSSSLPDGGNYNPAACCPDTVYIEGGEVVRSHVLAQGVCPPPSVMTVSCKSPVQVFLDSIGEPEAKAIRVGECLPMSEAVKMGPDSIKNAQLLKYNDGSVEVAYWLNKYCDIDADLSFELSGDTLSVNLAEIRLKEDCSSYCRLRIGVPDTLQDFSYFKFEDRAYGLLR